MTSKEADNRNHNRRMLDEAKEAIETLVKSALAAREVGSLGVTVHLSQGKIGAIYQETKLRKSDT